MEVVGHDDRAKKFCAQNEEQIVALVHHKLGRASIVDVRTSANGTITLTTAAGSVSIGGDEVLRA